MTNKVYLIILLHSACIAFSVVHFRSDHFFDFPQESAEHHNRLLSDRTQEIQELRKQLSNRQQQLTTAERHNSTAAQESHLETAELRALLAEKDSIISVSSSGMQHLNSNLNHKIVKM